MHALPSDSLPLKRRSMLTFARSAFTTFTIMTPRHHIFTLLQVSDNVYLYTTRHESVKGQCTGFTFELECQKGVAVAFTLDLSNCDNLIFVDGQVKCTKTVPKFTRVVINEAKRMNPARGFSLKLKMGIKEVKPAAWQQFEDEVFDDSGTFPTSVILRFPHTQPITRFTIPFLFHVIRSVLLLLRRIWRK